MISMGLDTGYMWHRIHPIARSFSLRVFALAVVLSAWWHSAIAFELKGVAPEKNLAELKKQYPSLRCSTFKFEGENIPMCEYQRALAGSPAMPRIRALDSLGGAPADGWVIRIEDGKVAQLSVSLKASYFDQVAGALTEKYGRPSKRQPNAGKIMMLVWKTPQETLEVRRRSESPGDMTVYLVSNRWQESFKARLKDKKKAGANDL